MLVILDDARSYLTNASGWYGFFNLAPGQHTVRHAQPVHMTSTTANEYTVIVEPGSTVDELNFGQIPLPPGQIQSPVVLNEFLPSPASDWDGNGVADADDEWIELTNPGDAPVDVSGWWLDDEAESLLRAPDGSAPYMLPIGSVIPARGFLVVFRSTSGVALNNSGDDVRLIGPASYEVETFALGSTGYDISWSKTADGGDQWINSYPPSPGAGNQPGSATATPSVTSTASATATPTPAGTPTPLPDGISLNEYLPDPASDWDGNGVIDAEDEYVEIYNANSFAVDLTGWMLDDLAGGGSQPYHFPAGTSLPGQGFLVVYRSHSSVALNNDGDHVRLLGPDGSVIEETEYDTSDDDLAYSKLVEGSSLWTDVYPPSPGLPNLPGATATPTPLRLRPTGSPSPTTTATTTPPPVPGSVRLNEFMPDPASDWNGDGTPDAADEYIELFNPGPDPVRPRWMGAGRRGRQCGRRNLPLRARRHAAVRYPCRHADPAGRLPALLPQRYRCRPEQRRRLGTPAASRWQPGRGVRVHEQPQRRGLQQARGRRHDVDQCLPAVARRQQLDRRDADPCSDATNPLPDQRQPQRVHA